MEQTTEEPIDEIIENVDTDIQSFNDDWDNFGDHSICSF